MGFNVPDLEQDNFSFGPGILYIGLSGCQYRPWQDIGAVRSGAELAIVREKITVEQGSPYQRITDYVIRETVTLTVTGIEWDFDNLRAALGAGVLEPDLPGVMKRFRFGGDMGVCHLPLMFVHHTAEGDDLYIKFWCALGNGEITITFGDDLHEFPYSFTAIQGTKRGDPLCVRAWRDDPHQPAGLPGDEPVVGEILPSREHLFEIYRDLNPAAGPCG